jgi:hypothetical protein
VNLPPENPYSYGAIGDGLTHLVTTNDVANNPQWDGQFVVGDEWDYVGWQAALNAAFGTPAAPNGYSASNLNRGVDCPGGFFRINRPLLVNSLVGGQITGRGRFTTRLWATGINQAVFRTNDCSSSTFSGIAFVGLVANNGALFYLDSDGTLLNGNGLQSNTFQDCFFGGNANAAFGLSIGAGGRMGSENLFLNCRFSQFSTAAVLIDNYNALNNTFVGGNVQNCPGNGILVQAGSCNIHGMAFENGLNTGGYDIAFANSANDCSTVTGCRSESLNFLISQNGHQVSVRGCNVVRNGSFVWAPNTPVSAGATCSAIVAGNGLLYLCSQAGTTGTSPPTWLPGTQNVLDGTAVWTGLDPVVVFLQNSRIQDCLFPWGRVSVDLQSVVLNCGFTRHDAITPRVLGTVNQSGNWVYSTGGPDSGGPAVPL